MAKEKVVVIGQGYVGLPVAMAAVSAGYDVVGIDLNPHRVRGLVEGISYVEDISDERLQQALASGRYTASMSYESAEGFDYAVITVPTPLKETLPDLSYIEDSARSLGPYLRKGATVVLESTTYPGTTQELLVPLLEEGCGLKAGKDFHVGYSPERIDPGNKTYTFETTPKVVSGITPESLDAVNGLYSQLVETTVPINGTSEAELAKLLENTFRHVNIAMVNELAVFAHALGIDIWQAIEAANTKPFGFMKFTPGPGVGGHCLPVDPSYLAWQVRRQLGTNFRFVELANDVNDHMPQYVVQRTIELLNEDRKALFGSRVLLVGVSYKKDSGDIRESPSLKVIDLLRNWGAEVVAADPMVEDYQWPANADRVHLTSEEVAKADAIVLLTPHSDFDLDLLGEAQGPVLDTVDATGLPNVHRL